MSLLNDLIAAAMQLAGTDDQVNHNARFCETHGRDEVAVEPDGSEYRNECEGVDSTSLEDPVSKKRVESNSTRRRNSDEKISNGLY